LTYNKHQPFVLILHVSCADHEMACVIKPIKLVVKRCLDYTLYTSVREVAAPSPTHRRVYGLSMCIFVHS